MARILNAIKVLIASLPLAACSFLEKPEMPDEWSLPQGQCQLKVDVGAEVARLVSTCAGVGADVESSKALLQLANSRRIFFQPELGKDDLTDGVKTIEEVLSLSYTGRHIGQVGGGYLPAEANDFWKNSVYIFIAADAGQVKVTFNTGSDAVVVSRQDDGSIAADYVIY
jgi:hypothetical protein